MIKRINKIKNFGVFQNYRRSGDIRDFDEKNIIYGWNYSGKTTLSRLVSYLDKDIVIDEEYKDVEFEVELEDGSKIDNINRISSSLHIKVFNRDFIRDNLHFDSSDKKINGIKFAVGDTGNILEQIEIIDKYITKAKTIIDRNQSNINAFLGFETHFTNEARHLTDLLGFGRVFTKTNVRNYVQEWAGQPLESFVISDETELKKVLTNATSQNTGSIIDTTNSPSTQYETLCNQVKTILKRQPQPSADDELLSSDRDLYYWAKSGLELYNKKNPQPQRCAFCGGLITKEGRLAELNAYYSNEASMVKSEIEQLKQKIEEEKLKFENLDWSRKSDNDLAQSCRAGYLEKKYSYQPIKDAYKVLLDVLISKLDDKYSNSLFVPMEIGIIEESANIAIQEWVSAVAEIFNNSNAIIENFNATKENAKNQYVKHYIAKFLIDHNYREIERKKEAEERWGGIINDAIKQKEEEKKRLSAKLESVEKGKEELKGFIKLFLNREDLDIVVTEDNYFVLKRGEKIATHLSEGERTAIAFSHFMVTLKSLKDENKLQKYIIFLDDPISSLDSNHIAQVYSLINSFFFVKGIDPANPDKKCLCSNQLFISTHNFDFYSFINKATVLGKNKHCAQFMIRRNKLASTITNMPDSFKRYNSEYVYLFSEIKKAKEKKDCLKEGELFPEDEYYYLPNIIRRFLEIYTLIKLPGHTGEIDDRIKQLVGNVNELKILHTFSHFTSFERVTKHNELLSRLPDILDDIFVVLGKDTDHLRSLEEGVNNLS